MTALARLRKCATADGASSLAEFAISLPLLIVLVVGIFDFGGAFNQKQQLVSIMRDAARFGASSPTNDLAYGTAPPSINAIRDLVDGYLIAARLPDCGLGTAVGSPSGPPWAYDSTGGCPSPGVILTIYRDPQAGPNGSTSACTPLPTQNYGTNGLNVFLTCTRVSISYPYQWHFNSVIQLLVPGSNLGLSQLYAVATAVNMN